MFQWNKSALIKSLQSFCVLAYACFYMWFKYHNCIPEYPCEHATATITSNPARLPARLYLDCKIHSLHGKSGSTGISNSSTKEPFSPCKMNQTDVAENLEQHHEDIWGTPTAGLSLASAYCRASSSFSVILLSPRCLQHSFQNTINCISASIFVFVLQNDSMRASGSTGWWLNRETNCMT